MSFLNDIQMKTKLIALFLLVGLIPLAIGTGIGIWRSGDALQRRAFEKLDAVREIKSHQIEGYFDERKSDMKVLADTVQALRNEGFDKIAATQATKRARLEDYFTTLVDQIHNLQDDPYIQEAVVALEAAFESSGGNTGSAAWKNVAASYDRRLKDIAEDNGWYNLLLIAPDGDVVYTVRREDALGLRISDSELAGSSLGTAYREAQTLSGETVAVGDFASYVDGSMAAFMVAPMHISETLAGYVAFHLTPNKINAIVQERTGLGTTGESYLVGESGGVSAYRSDRVVKTGHIGDLRSGSYVERALAGESGLQTEVGSIGDLELTAYAPLDLPGLNWAIVTTMALEEVIVPQLEGAEGDFFTEYVNRHGYYDLFLIDTQGYVFYSVKHEVDYETNLVSGKFKDTNLAALFRQVKETNAFGVADFDPYAPSDGAQAAFIAQPVLGTNGDTELVVALQLPYEHINDIMQERTGMGKSGETYLVGLSDGAGEFRSDMTTMGDGRYVIGTEINTSYVEDALAGNSDARDAEDSEGNDVLVSYEPIEVDGLSWAAISKIDRSEVMEPANELRNILGGVGIVIALVVALVAFVFATSIANPIQLITDGARRLSIGDAHLAGMDLQAIEAVNRRGDELGEIGKAFSALIAYFKSGAETMQRIAVGDLSMTVEAKDESDLMGNAMVTMKRRIQMMAGDVNTLIDAAVAGRLDTRADASKFEGEYHAIVQGVNDTLDAVIGPLNVAASYVDRISKGDIPEPITDEYRGDFNAIKENLNLLIHTLNLFIDELDRMNREQAAGDIDAAIEINHFTGAYHEIAQGLNDQVFEHIRIKKEIVRVVGSYGEGDFTAKMEQLPGKKAFINRRLDVVRENLQNLVHTVNQLSRDAVAGKLDTRADISRFKGDWATLVEGFNDTLDAVIGPLNVAADYVDMIANGEIPAPITEEYQGDFGTLRDNLNVLSESLREMLQNIKEASNNLSAASAEILAATTQQASGANEQSAAITQTTTTVDEVKAISEQAVLRAQEVADASQRTVDVSRAGRQAVDETLESMARIKEQVEGIAGNILALSDQTQQIGEITATVNDIASQSNMLALNASVEAARAGEHGKGFAVVAVEVRNLAEQSKQATAQVRAILTDIQNAINASVMVTEEGAKVVDEGVQRAAQAREAIEQLSSVIVESAQIASQVVAGGQQQASGVEQIAMAMQNINQAMVQNLASTRQAEKSAQDLNSLATTLTTTVQQYRIENGRSGNGQH